MAGPAILVGSIVEGSMMRGSSRLRRVGLGIGVSVPLIFLALMLGLLLYPRAAKTGPEPLTAPPVATRPVRAEIAIEGMDCIICAAGPQNKLRTIHGVSKVEVSYQDKRATVEFDPAIIDRAQLVEAIQSDGLKVTTPVPRP